MKNPFSILRWVYIILVPVLLFMTSIRIFLNPWVFVFEYHRPNFPPDSYGFSLEDRLKWSDISLQYLLNQAEPSFLADLQFPDGSPLYNAAEVSHMVDVKILIQRMIMVWYLILVVFAATGWITWRKGVWKEYLGSLFWGGWVTLALIAAVILGVTTGFDALFTGFHRIFFTGDTWLFAYSDTLIRLFPMVFWRDAFIGVGGVSALGALILIVVFRRYRLW
jgi:integral membrane protein (TIGR01906 family)